MPKKARHWVRLVWKKCPVSIGHPHWTALLDSLIGQPYWTTLLNSLIGQPYFIEGTFSTCNYWHTYFLIGQPYRTTLLLIGQPYFIDFFNRTPSCFEPCLVFKHTQNPDFFWLVTHVNTYSRLYSSFENE